MFNRNICFNFSYSILLNLLFFTKQGIPSIDVKIHLLKSDLDRLNEMKKTIENLHHIKKTELEDVSRVISTNRASLQTHQLELMAKREQVINLQRKIQNLENEHRINISKQREINKSIQSVCNDIKSFEKDINKVSDELRMYEHLKKRNK
ncbi:hypothetical protein EDEG_00042 [Edhazardia aedis USNM 41457]|uniref:Uncharacterized protein n=1 Tax=Edhazardia aedis (strain USNM 41457) TaxID=1003232 RepID=J8ZP19_EDHAE|nr:hypothetical protein EDEG_00042 [Edhazardia aedis USNM 41457]|eukprot:EJW01448.1 hypothetical protein EDEG_00042 [Edhazardia aedis USNM 41457]